MEPFDAEICPNRIIKAPTPPGSEAMATMPAYGQQYQVVCVPNPAGGYTQVQISGGPQHPNSGLNANPCAPQKEGNVLSTRSGDPNIFVSNDRLSRCSILSLMLIF